MSQNSLDKLNREQLLLAQKQASQLVHDLGKQLTRAARNLPETKIPKALIEMMVTDLYELKGSRTAQQVFRELAAPLYESIGDPRLDRIGVLLDQISQLESLIRIGDQAALREAAKVAIEVDTILRCIAGDIYEACDEPEKA